MCAIELTQNVPWCTATVRSTPPQINPLIAYGIPPTKYPTAIGNSHPDATPILKIFRCCQAMILFA